MANRKLNYKGDTHHIKIVLSLYHMNNCMEYSGTSDKGPSLERTVYNGTSDKGPSEKRTASLERTVYNGTSDKGPSEKRTASLERTVCNQ